MMQYETWPKIEPEHIDAVRQVALSGKWHYGEVYKSLEYDMEVLLNRPVITTTSCAWAIYLATRILGPFSKIAVPAYTYHGTVHPLMWNGIHPVFVDVNPKTFNMCAEDLRLVLKDGGAEAVVAVHIHGMPFDWEIVNICNEFEVPLIEDACQAHGAKIRDKLVGTIGEASAFSFNSRKIVPAGLGGAVAFRSPHHADRAKELRDYGKKNEMGETEEFGSYLPIGEFDAAIARVQLKKIDRWIEYANNLTSVLKSSLKERAPECPEDRTHTWHKYRIRGADDERLKLEENGVRTSLWVSRPLPSHPAYAPYSKNRSFPGAEDVCKNTFCLFDDNHPIMAQSVGTINNISKIIQEVLK